MRFTVCTHSLLRFTVCTHSLLRFTVCTHSLLRFTVCTHSLLRFGLTMISYPLNNLFGINSNFQLHPLYNTFKWKIDTTNGATILKPSAVIRFRNNYLKSTIFIMFTRN